MSNAEVAIPTPTMENLYDRNRQFLFYLAVFPFHAGLSLQDVLKQQSVIFKEPIWESEFEPIGQLVSTDPDVERIIDCHEDEKSLAIINKNGRIIPLKANTEIGDEYDDLLWGFPVALDRPPKFQMPLPFSSMQEVLKEMTSAQKHTLVQMVDEESKLCFALADKNQSEQRMIFIQPCKPTTQLEISSHKNHIVEVVLSCIEAYLKDEGTPGKMGDIGSHCRFDALKKQLFTEILIV